MQHTARPVCRAKPPAFYNPLVCSGLQNGPFRVVERAVLAPETCRIAAQKGLLGGSAGLMVEIDDTDAFLGCCAFAHTRMLQMRLKKPIRV